VIEDRVGSGHAGPSAAYRRPAGRGRSADLASALGMAPWQVDRARRDLNGWSEDGLAAAVIALAEADTAVKGGGRDPVYAVERAVLTIANARGS